VSDPKDVVGAATTPSRRDTTSGRRDASFDAVVSHAGFEIVRERVVTQDEPGHGPVSSMWALARRPE
jgi:hypothetical protein